MTNINNKTTFYNRITQCFSRYVCFFHNEGTEINTECSHTYKLSDEGVNNATWKDTKPFIPNITSCKVIKVYDGDTITVAARLHDSFPVNRFSVRLSGIDTPEMRSKNENEKNKAILAKDFLERTILEQTVILENVSTEKYGRLLATVYYNGMNMNEMMITNNYAVPYDGKTKKIPDSWL